MHARKMAVGAVLAAGMTLIGGSSAFAGEITGNGKEIVVKANSICAYSGLNDGDDGKVQNWGAIPKEFRDGLRAEGVEVPNNLCNGHLSPYPEAFGG